VREVAPCYDCGHDPKELDDLRAGIHLYREYELFGFPIVLCNFCDVDFCSYDPTYIGRPRVPNYYSQMIFRRDIEPTISRDKFCPTCNRRLAFLRFLAHARSQSDG
jgi:hypothetical protein